MDRFESSLSAHAHFQRAEKAPLRSLWDGGEFFDDLNDVETTSASPESRTNGMTLEARESVLQILERLASTQLRASAEETNVLPSWIHDFDTHHAPQSPIPAKIRKKIELGLLGNHDQRQNVVGKMSNHT